MLIRLPALVGGVLLCLVAMATPARPAHAAPPLADGAERLDGYRLVDVRLRSREELVVLNQLGQMVSCRPSPTGTLYLIAPEDIDELVKLELDYEILSENVQVELDEFDRLRAEARAQRGADFFADYRTFAEVNVYLDELVALNPGIATKFLVGNSIENRPIFGVRIASPGGPTDRPQIAITGTQHAREWIATMAVMFAADRLIRGYGVDPDVTELVDNVEFHIIPVCNPDGYVYSHTTSRYWRKNRRDNGNGSFGVDLNRNWGYQWGAGPAGSSTSETTSDVYRGTSPFSEAETQMISAYLSTLERLRGHIDTHTFAQLILGPWAYNDTVTPPRVPELRATQEAMEAAMTSAAGATYTAGLGIDQLLYTADGTMPDWVFAATGALAWTYELRPSSGGLAGFSPPPSSIIPAGEEAYAGYRQLALFAQLTVQLREVSDYPAIVLYNTPTPVSVDVIPWHQTQIVPGSGRVHYRFNGAGSFLESPLTGGPDTLTGTIPGAPCGATIEFYFSAAGPSGVIVAPEGAPTNVLTIEALNIHFAFSDDFETDKGWTVSGVVSDGAWERGIPAGFGDRGDPTTDYDGSGQCYLTGNRPGNSDVDNGTTILTSPAFDFSAGGILEYAYWLDDGPGSVGAGDGLFVEYATNTAGTNWTRIRTYTQPQPFWRTDNFEVGSEISASPTFRIRFLAADVGGGHLIEAAIDAVRAYTPLACPPSGCEGDADGSGAVDLDDLTFVVLRLGTSAPNDDGADVDGSGSVDLDDLTFVVLRLGECD